jgi:WD40 repeat protein
MKRALSAALPNSKQNTNPEDTNFYLLSLSQDEITVTASFLNVQEVASLIKTCNKLKDIIDSDTLWYILCKRDIKDTPSYCTKNWKMFYEENRTIDIRGIELKHYSYAKLTGIELKDGSLAFATKNKVIKLLKKGEEEATDLTGHDTIHITALTLLKDGRFVSGGHDKLIKIWNGETCDRTFQTEIIIEKIKELHDGRLAAVSWDYGQMEIWDEKTDSSVTVQHTDGFRCVCELDDGTIATGHVTPDILIWNLETLEHQHKWSGHEKGIRCLIMLKNKNVASASDDFSIKIWTQQGQCLSTIDKCHFGYITVLFQLRDGRLVTGSDRDDGRIKLWDVSSGRMLLEFEGHIEGETNMTQLKDGKLLSVGYDGATIWS